MSGTDDATPAIVPVDIPIDVAVDVVVPVYNEEGNVERSIRRLHRYLSANFPLSWMITIADNASTDRTLEISRDLTAELGGIRVLHLDRKGRGAALRAAWSTSRAAVVSYMDVDLSTGLDALLPLVAPLVSGHSDISTGTRLARGAQIVRGPRREIISRIYNRIVASTLRTSFTDAQCGFKAVRADVARQILPLVEDDSWFFDTELLTIAEHNGLRIHEVPVDWVDDPDSRVDVVATARDDLKGVARTLVRLSTGDAWLSGDVGPGDGGRRVAPLGVVDQLIRFGSIGLVSVLVASILFVVMAPSLGTVVANAVAFSICAVLNAGASHRYAAALRGRSARSRHFLGSLLLGAVPLVVSTLVLVALDLDGVTSLAVALGAVIAVNTTMTVARFVLMGLWARVDVRGGEVSASRIGATPTARTRAASADT